MQTLIRTDPDSHRAMGALIRLLLVISLVWVQNISDATKSVLKTGL